MAIVLDKSLAAVPLVLAIAIAAVASPASGAPDHIIFADACAPGDRLSIAAVGDLLFHKRLQLQAYAKGGDFKRFFAPLAGVIADADLAYGNLESPVADGVALGGRAARDPGRRLDGRVYSADLATLNFNVHPSVIGDLKSVGFDIVSTANNHAMDRGALGVDRTIANLDAAGLAFTGTRSRGELTRPFSVVTAAKGFRVAWLACSFSTNGNPDRDAQVLDCFKGRDAVLAEVARLAADSTIDAVIVTPHWGIEGSHAVEQRQRELARLAVRAGAAAVIGTHPHVLQGWEKVTTADGRDGLVVYSTGNFISNQRRLPERTGVVVWLELVRPAPGTRARVAAVGAIPTWVEIDDRGHRVSALTPARKALTGVLKAALRIVPAGNVIGAEARASLRQGCAAAAN